MTFWAWSLVVGMVCESCQFAHGRMVADNTEQDDLHKTTYHNELILYVSTRKQKGHTFGVSWCTNPNTIIPQLEEIIDNDLEVLLELFSSRLRRARCHCCNYKIAWPVPKIYIYH